MSDAASDHARVLAWGDELIKVHDLFRQEFATVREEFDRLLGGHPAPAGAGQLAPRLSQQLRNRCLTVCEWLHGHHAGESTTVFPHLEQEFPELGSALERLRQEHVVVERILDDLRALLGENGSGDVGKVRADFERLASEMDVHLAHEEEQIVPALNALTGAVPWEEPAEHLSGVADEPA